MAIQLPPHGKTLDERALRAYLIEAQTAGSQDVFVAFDADSGSTVADTTTDTLSVAGGSGITTSISGDVLTINSNIAGETTVTAAAGDLILIADVSDSNNIKKVTAETIAQTTNDYLFTELAVGSAISLTTNTPVNITSVSLTAGDWDVRGGIAFVTAATTSITKTQGSLSLTTDTLSTIGDSTLPGFANQYAAFVPNVTTLYYGVTPGRQSLGTTTTIYLVAQATFTVSTMTAYGFISARRCG